MDKHNGILSVAANL